MLIKPHVIDQKKMVTQLIILTVSILIMLIVASDVSLAQDHEGHKFSADSLQTEKIRLSPQFQQQLESSDQILLEQLTHRKENELLVPYFDKLVIELRLIPGRVTSHQRNFAIPWEC